MNIIIGFVCMVVVFIILMTIITCKNKNEEEYFIMVMLESLLAFPFFLFGLDCFNIGSYFSFLFSIESWFDFCGTYFSTVVTVFFSVYIATCMTNKQIRINSKESYRPRLRLKDLQRIEKNNDIYQYIVDAKNINKKISGDEYVSVKINLENIGNGLAQNIRFYSLHNAEECVRVQSVNTKKEQKNFSTEEIVNGGSEEFVFDIHYKIKKDKKAFERADYALILCEYTDINENPYEILMGITIKNKIENEEGEKIPIIDYYYYQGGTESFERMIEKNKEQYKKIKKH
ncbi:MAG: hypothetical protein IJX99_10230 [Clostridia bacterium]|nr:hypothetical protein [Clostridia bacterium]